MNPSLDEFVLSRPKRMIDHTLSPVGDNTAGVIIMLHRVRVEELVIFILTVLVYRQEVHREVTVSYTHLTLPTKA